MAAVGLKVMTLVCLRNGSGRLQLTQILHCEANRGAPDFQRWRRWSLHWRSLYGSNDEPAARAARTVKAWRGVRLQSHQPMKKPATMTIPSTEQDVTGAAVAAEKNGFSLISDGKLLALYAARVKCRMIAERAKLPPGLG